MRDYKTINFETGFVLIIVLFFMLIIGMESLYSFQALIIENKMLADFKHYQTRYRIANSLLEKIEQEIPLKQHSEGTIKQFKFSYIIEQLGIKSCAKVNNQNAAFYRINLLVQSLSRSNEKILLQSTIVRPDNSIIGCEGNPHNVKIGRQSWLEI